jgi:predicted nucleic acid-binding protein
VIVLDASAAVELLLGTERGRRVADRLSDDVVVPELLDVECLSAIARLERAGTVSPADAGAAVTALRTMPATRLSHLAVTARVWELRERVRVADAVYAATAELVGAPLLTCDRRLAAAPLTAVDVLLVG